MTREIGGALVPVAVLFGDELTAAASGKTAISKTDITRGIRALACHT